MPNRQYLANAIRALSMDAVQQANSGHPGMPMGMADIAEVLWNDFLKHNPSNPSWMNRDRFIVSNGHGSMLLYSLLHLSGYDLPLDELKNFRQLHSKTPGHPENHLTPGVETTTGPLGQGIANAVGMALGESILASRFNKPDYKIIDHYTYAFMGDGCMMEGISHEVCSLAGTFGLGKLIAFWDDNKISIDGHTDEWFTDNTPERFRAYQWHVIENVDGHNPDAIKKAVIEAQKITDKPSLICCKTIIGYGAPNAQGGEKCHGAPLGEDEIALAKKTLNWPHAPFEVPQDVYQAWDAAEKGQAAENEWAKLLSTYQTAYPELAQQLQIINKKELPENWDEVTQAFIEQCQDEQEKLATRKASQICLNVYAPMLPALIGGSADLTGSNLTNWSGSKKITKEDYTGNYIHFGVREFGMTAIANGLALYNGLIPYVGTFLTFTDYARNAVRMAALMQLQNILVYTHDSIGLGEDGPTHQPIEHIAMLRATPNLHVWRPCDMTETAVAWKHAIETKQTPSALLLSRQGLRHELRTKDQVADIAKGGYIVHEPSKSLDLIFIATGSEVHLAVDAAKELEEQGIFARVVSMPCVEVFDNQTTIYKESVLPDVMTKRLAIEAGTSQPWYKYVGLQGRIIGIDRFGESAPAVEIFKELGFTVDNIKKQALALLGE